MAKLKRACNSQKCIRAGGKHNDLDDVGKDLYHHTFFEMLGNWSFGDYFKEEAIAWAWECLTKTFGLNPERIYATYFGGDELKAPGVPSDEETRQIWLKYLPSSRVLPFDAGDNFWEMGDSGPCGPCTEIHYDRIGNRDAAKLVNMDDPNVIEIWNNVFIQYNRDSSGLKSLPAQHVDTGMGFERLASILQNKMSNYDTDIFTPLFDEIQQLIGSNKLESYQGQIAPHEHAAIDMAYRVVTDHIRTLSFAIADGALPDKLGRGYVLRRVLRRAVWYAQRYLKAPKAFVYKLVPKLVQVMGQAYPELVKAQSTIEAVLLAEERDFNRTIDKGAKFFAKKADEIFAKQHKQETTSSMLSTKKLMFSGYDAFHLSGSLGFPLDLTQIMCEERGLEVDIQGYQEALDQEKAKNEEALRIKKAVKANMADLTMAAEQTNALATMYKVKKTLTEAKYVWHEELDAEIKAIYLGRGAGPKGDGFVDTIQADTAAGLILDKTSFYAEMGGQAADSGELIDCFKIDDVQIYGGYVVHLGTSTVPLKVNSKVTCAVDYDRRAKIAPNHTMTHVLNFALREVLLGGYSKDANENSCAQRGSDVDDLRLRFDFSWDKPLTQTQLCDIEKICCDQIDQALKVEAEEIPLAQALDIPSLRCMKGESYPDPVRVVAVGCDLNSLRKNTVNATTAAKYSIELCGGTHLRNTSDALSFVILDETGIAKGVRRIVAVTREKAKEALATAVHVREELATLEKNAINTTSESLSSVENHVKKVKDLIKDAVIPAADRILAREKLESIILGPIKKAQKSISEAKVAASATEFAKLAQLASATPENESHLFITRIDFGVDSKLWQKLHKQHLAKVVIFNNSFLVISATSDKFCIFAISADTDKIDASKLARHCAEAAGGGKGGGKPNSANFIVSNINCIDAAQKAAADFATCLSGITVHKLE